MNIFIPDAIDLASPEKVVFFFHSAGQNASQMNASYVIPMVNAWLDQNWICIGLNSNGPASWGNDSARTGQLFDWNWLKSWCQIQGVFVYGLSMGGLNSLNFMMDAKNQGIPILAYVGNSAVTNVAYQFDNNLNHRPLIQGAYNLPSTVTSDSDPLYTAAIDTDNGGHDPQKHAVSAFPTVAFRFYCGTTDTAVIPADNSDLFIAKLNAASWPREVSRVSYVGGHGASNSFQPADCVSFYLRSLT